MIDLLRDWGHLPSESQQGAKATGRGLLRAYEYNPATPAFISPDPLLDPYQPTDLDSYDYATGNPVAGEDPTGLACIDNNDGACVGLPLGPPGGGEQNPDPGTGGGGATATPVAPVGCSSAAQSRYDGCDPEEPGKQVAGQRDEVWLPRG